MISKVILTLPNFYRHNKRPKIYISENIHPQTLSVVQTRAEDLDIKLVVGPIEKADLTSREYAGILLQYPDTFGDVKDFADVAKVANKNGVSSGKYSICSLLLNRIEIKF